MVTSRGNAAKAEPVSRGATHRRHDPNKLSVLHSPLFVLLAVLRLLFSVTTLQPVHAATAAYSFTGGSLPYTVPSNTEYLDIVATG
jgi:hypothetical protein